MSDIAYLNGAWLPLAQAQIPVMDRGFQLGDGVYEVIPAYGGKCFALDGHLRRLDRSLRELQIANPHTSAEWRALIAELIAKNGGGDKPVYLQVTRGVALQRGHAFTTQTPPTVFALCQTLPAPNARDRAEGVAALVLPDIRWGRCDIKAITLLPNLLATQQAKQSGCNEAILHRDGRVTEGASSNVWAVVGGRVVTPPEGPEILSGITRIVLLELLRGAGVPVEERPLALDELRRAGEVWVSSSVRELLAVVKLDQAAVGTGRPGPVYEKTQRLFQEAKRQGRE